MILWAIEETEGKECFSLAHDAPAPWSRFAPEYQHGQIPVPGRRGTMAESVKGVWEGMKLIGPKGKVGRMNTGYFTGPGRDRPVKEGEWFSGFHFEGRAIGLQDALKLIFLPTYLWTIQNHCPDLLGNLKVLARNRDVWLYDGNASVDLFDDTMPLSHAAIVVAFLNNAMEDFQRGYYPHSLMGSILQ